MAPRLAARPLPPRPLLQQKLRVPGRVEVERLYCGKSSHSPSKTFAEEAAAAPSASSSTPEREAGFPRAFSGHPPPGKRNATSATPFPGPHAKGSSWASLPAFPRDPLAREESAWVKTSKDRPLPLPLPQNFAKMNQTAGVSNTVRCPSGKGGMKVCGKLMASVVKKTKKKEAPECALGKLGCTKRKGCVCKWGQLPLASYTAKLFAG